MNQRTILIAEDDALLRKALTDKLTREGFIVLEARNGEECLEKAFRSHPDLILLDVLMPRMDGITALKKLREDSWGITVKVILLTNMSNAEEMAEQNPYRTEGYLIKSETKIRDVVAAIRSHLNVKKLFHAPLTADAELPEYRCTCGKLLFKGALLFSTIEVKCKGCRTVQHIDTSDGKSLG